MTKIEKKIRFKKKIQDLKSNFEEWAEIPILKNSSIEK